MKKNILRKTLSAFMVTSAIIGGVMLPKQVTSAATSYDVTVAQDGSGNYKTITAAYNYLASINDSKRKTIHVKKGTYKEQLTAGEQSAPCASSKAENRQARRSGSPSQRPA